MRQQEQKLPPWVWASIDERLVEAAETSVEAWRRTLRRDPCAYCGGPGGDVDHITPQAHGGSDSWINLTAAPGPRPQVARQRWGVQPLTPR